MKTRVITSVVGIILLIFAFLLYETLVFDVLFCAITLIAIHEIFDAFGFKKKDLPLFIAFIPLVFFVMLLPFFGMQKWITAALYAFLLFISIYFVQRNKHIDFTKFAGMTLYSLLVLFCFFTLLSLKKLLPQGDYGYDAVYVTVMVMGFAWGGDTFAYLVGRRFGKRKLAPNVSPNKTVEGAAGGIFGSMLLGVLISFLYTQFWPEGTLWQEGGNIYYLFVAVLGAFASVLGMLGDLFASGVKRQCGIKDYGTIFPGHGGIMDRFDSLLLIAPLMALAVQFHHSILR